MGHDLSKKVVAPQDGATPSVIANSLIGGSESLVAIAVGQAEGTRTPDGGFTPAFYGHTDPGNGARNQGSFSYQHAATSPGQADLLQLEKFIKFLLPKFLEAMGSNGVSDANLLKLWLIACDVYTQSEAACLLKGGFLDRLANMKAGILLDVKTITEMRLLSYFDPKTNKLDAPGFGNDVDRVRADQKRRTEAVLSVLS